RSARGAGSSGASASITATESEWKIVLSKRTLKAGRYTFVAVNKGHFGHSLALNGPGLANKRIAGTVSPGSSKTIVLTLRKGTYDVYCPIDGHKGLGMNTKLSVT